MKLGAQMYTLRAFSQTESDLRETLRRVAGIGYRTVQISGIGPIKPEIVREICDANGLEIAITHTNQERVLNETEAVIAEHRVLGCRYIGLGCMPPRYLMDGWRDRFFADYAEPARKIRDAGMLLMYHNHGYEFEKIGGSRIIETLADDFAPDLLGFTLDTYWVQAAGGDPVEWVKKLSGRLPCVHLKDMAVVGGKSVMAPVLEGNMNFEAIINALSEAGTEYLLVEQDECLESAFTCLEKSYRNLSALGYA